MQTDGTRWIYIHETDRGSPRETQTGGQDEGQKLLYADIDISIDFKILVTSGSKKSCQMVKEKLYV
jgi:hypothetical protein